MAEQLDNELFLEAKNNLAVYNDDSTLIPRLQQIAARLRDSAVDYVGSPLRVKGEAK